MFSKYIQTILVLCLNYNTSELCTHLEQLQDMPYEQGSTNRDVSSVDLIHSYALHMFPISPRT